MLALNLIVSLLLVPQAPVAAPTCTELLNGLRAKTEADYAGFVLEIRDTRRQAYDRELAALGEIAGRTEGDQCFPVLDRYVTWFDDPHLFVFQRTGLDTAETRRRMAQQRTVVINESTVRTALDHQGKAADPIQGIWYDRGRRIAVIPDPDGTARRFLGVVLVSDTVTLPVGTVIAVFDRAKSEYTTALTWPSLAVTHPPTKLHRGGTLLRISPAMWGKLYPGPAAERALLDTADVRRPTLTWRGEAAIFSLTSHDPRWRGTVDSMVKSVEDRLRTATALIIDLRGNEGGGSQTTDRLNPYLVTEQHGADAQSPADAVMLSSPDQISYAKRGFGPETSPFVQRLVQAMEAAPGQLIPLFPPGDTSYIGPKVLPVTGPKKVLLLIDGGTVSAAEVMVLIAKQAGRARVVGQPTDGALDYQSTSIVSIVKGENRWYLGYPTITANNRLPKDGMRGKGIAPDRKIDWEKTSDPIAAALAQ